MGALYKKEVVIRPTSTMTVQGAIDWTQNWLMTAFQDKAENKDANGNYIDYFFADIFDSRTGNIYRVFSNPCTTAYSLTTLNFEILDKSKFATTLELASVSENVSNNGVLIAQNTTTLGEHDSRLDALENQSSEVQAVVI